MRTRTERLLVVAQILNERERACIVKRACTCTNACNKLSFDNTYMGAAALSHTTQQVSTMHQVGANGLPNKNVRHNYNTELATPGDGQNKTSGCELNMRVSVA